VSKAARKIKNLDPHKWKQSATVYGSVAPFRTQLWRHVENTTNSCLQTATDFPFGVNISLSVIQSEWKEMQLPVQMRETSHKSAIKLSALTKWLKGAIVFTENCNSLGLSQVFNLNAEFQLWMLSKSLHNVKMRPKISEYYIKVLSDSSCRKKHSTKIVKARNSWLSKKFHKIITTLLL
jgi:hypothetical protein